MIKITTITPEELNFLCQHGEAIDNKGGYPAVVIHPDDTITKLWARKRKLLSSATLCPYSNRFVRNAEELKRQGIAVPEILSHATVKNSHVRIVTYRPLPGQSIRELLSENPESVNIPELCEYIYQLHQKGILFRSMHLGNIIQGPGANNYGLIDFTDVKFYSRPAPLLRRAANLATPLRYTQDIDHIKEAGLPSLQKSYLNILQLSKTKKQRFNDELNRYLK